MNIQKKRKPCVAWRIAWLLLILAVSSCAFSVEEIESIPAILVKRISGEGQRLLLVGDSRTYSWPDGYFTRYEIWNWGVPGAQTRHWIGWTEAHSPVMKEQYDIAIVCLGINDAGFFPDLKPCADSLALICTRLKSVADRVYITTVPSVFPGGVISDDRIEAYVLTADYLNRMIRGAGLAFTDGIIDIAAIMNTRDGFLKPVFNADGIHFTPAAYDFMEAAYLYVIENP